MNSKILFLSLISLITINLNGMNADSYYEDKSCFFYLLPGDFNAKIKKLAKFSEINEYYDGKINPEYTPLLARMIDRDQKLSNIFYLRSELEKLKVAYYNSEFFEMGKALDGEVWWQCFNNALEYSTGDSYDHEINFQKIRTFVQGLNAIACLEKELPSTYTPQPRRSGEYGPARDDAENPKPIACAQWLILNLKPFIKHNHPVPSLPVPQVKKLKPKTALEYHVGDTSKFTWYNQNDTQEFIKLLNFIRTNYQGLIAGLQKAIEAENNVPLMLQEFKAYTNRNQALFRELIPQTNMPESSMVNSLETPEDLTLDQAKNGAQNLVRIFDLTETRRKEELRPHYCTQYQQNLISLYNVIKNSQTNEHNDSIRHLAQKVLEEKNELMLTALPITRFQDIQFSTMLLGCFFLELLELDEKVEEKFKNDPTKLTCQELCKMKVPIYTYEYSDELQREPKIITVPLSNILVSDIPLSQPSNDDIV